MDKEGSGKLDLGLSSLIDGARAELKSSLEQAGSLSEVLKKSVELSQSQLKEKVEDNLKSAKNESPAEENEFSEFARKSDWAELSKFCEKKLADSNDADKNAKLWWIKCQYETKSIPVSILAPSLNLIASDILSQELKSETNRAVCGEMLHAFSKNLISNNDYELVLLFMGHLLTSGYKNTKEISFLLNELEGKLKKESTFQDNDELIKDLNSLKFRHKLNIYNDVFDKIEITETTFNKQELKPEAAETIKSENRSRKYLYLSGFAILISCLLYFSGSLFGTSFKYLDSIFDGTFGNASSADFKPSLELASSYTEHSLIEPQPERVAGLNHIDAVFYEVSNTVERPPASESSLSDPARSDITSVSQTSPAAKLPNRSPQELSQVGTDAQMPAKEKVNTSYPLERRPIDEPADVTNQDENIPEIDFPPYRSNGSRGNSGTKDYSVNVKRSASEPNFLVIARTKVMKEPTYWSETTADLAAGDRVLVEEELGKWLRIKAKNGNIGYILAQDADKIY